MSTRVPRSMQLNPWCHMDYFNNVRTTFLVVTLLPMKGQILDFNKNIWICVPKMNECLKGLERHEGEYLTVFFIFGWTIPLRLTFATTMNNFYGTCRCAMLSCNNMLDSLPLGSHCQWSICTSSRSQSAACTNWCFSCCGLVSLELLQRLPFHHFHLAETLSVTSLCTSNITDYLIDRQQINELGLYKEADRKREQAILTISF